MSMKKKIQAGERDYSPPDPLSMGFSKQESWSGCHFLFQGIFLTLGSNPGLLHCRRILYHCVASEAHVRSNTTWKRWSGKNSDKETFEQSILQTVGLEIQA